MRKSSQKVYMARYLWIIVNMLQTLAAINTNLRFSGELENQFSKILPQCFGVNQSLKATHDELLCDELRVLREELEKVEPPKPDIVLEKFVIRLKSYVKFDAFDCLVFDTVNFDSDKKELHAEFAEIESWIGHLDIPELKFARYMLGIMTDASRFMKCYSNIPLLGHELVYTVVELHVSALSMLNFRGRLDLNIVNYRSKITKICDHICSSVKSFENLTAPSLLIKIMFKDQVRKAKTVLKVLEDHGARSLKYIPYENK